MSLKDIIEGEVEEVVAELVVKQDFHQPDITEIVVTSKTKLRKALTQQSTEAYERGVNDELNRETKNMDSVIAGMIAEAMKDERDRLKRFVGLRFLKTREAIEFQNEVYKALTPDKVE